MALIGNLKVILLDEPTSGRIIYFFQIKNNI